MQMISLIFLHISFKNETILQNQQYYKTNVNRYYHGFSTNKNKSQNLNLKKIWWVIISFFFPVEMCVIIMNCM